MRGDQRRAAFTPHQRKELGKHRVGCVFVKIAGRLVRQHQRGPVGERAGDREYSADEAMALASHPDFPAQGED